MNGLLTREQFYRECGYDSSGKRRLGSMALKALAQRPAKQAVKTLSELLAAVFTASNKYRGTFREDMFRISDYNIIYAGDDIDDAKPGENTDYLCFEAPFNKQETQYCCGLAEIGNFDSTILSSDPAVNEALMRVFMAGVHKEYNMVFGTVVASQKAAQAYLESVGFVEVAKYKSKCTGAMISVLMHEATKELPAGELDLENFDFTE